MLFLSIICILSHFSHHFPPLPLPLLHPPLPPLPSLSRSPSSMKAAAAKKIETVWKLMTFNKYLDSRIPLLERKCAKAKGHPKSPRPVSRRSFRTLFTRSFTYSFTRSSTQTFIVTSESSETHQWLHKFHLYWALFFVR